MIIRPATPGDTAGMAQILNRISTLGGTTAHQTPKSADTVLDHTITGPDVLCAVVAQS